MGYRNIKKQKKLIFFLQIEDFDFSMSRDNAYYQFYKNAPGGRGLDNIFIYPYSINEVTTNTLQTIKMTDSDAGNV